MAREPGKPEDALTLHEHVSLTLTELATATGVRREMLVEMVEHAILTPSGEDPGDWQFPGPTPLRVRRALRLRNDLELNWPGVALAVALLDELETLRVQHRALLRRLR